MPGSWEGSFGLGGERKKSESELVGDFSGVAGKTFLFSSSLFPDRTRQRRRSLKE